MRCVHTLPSLEMLLGYGSRGIARCVAEKEFARVSLGPDVLLAWQSGASKHFAYIEMSSKSVAEIVAETMDNYLLMGHILKCSVRLLR